MPQPDPTPERLADLLNDERARRAWAEQQLIAEKEKTRIWRSRADERAAELRRLKWRRAGRKATPQTPVLDMPEARTQIESRVRPLYAAVLAGVCDEPPWVADAFDTAPVDRPGIQLEALDLVVVGSDRALEHLAAWLGWEARPPLILTESVDPGSWAEFLRPGDVSIGRSIGRARFLDTRPVVPHRLAFDSAAAGWTEIDHSTPLDTAVRLAARGAALAWASEDPIPTALEGIVFTGSNGDSRKGGIAGRLRARRRFGLAGLVEELAIATGMSLPPSHRTVGVLLVTNRPERLAGALEGIARFEYPRLEVVVGLHGSGFDESPALVESWTAETGRPATVLRFTEEVTLGECLNRCAEATSAPVLAKIDDDDIYGPWYLDEAVDVATSTGADLVGKSTFAMMLESAGDLVLQAMGKENAEVAYVPGASFVFPRHSWERVPFAHRRSRVDSTLVRGLRSRGMTIWASSRYEFVVRRSASGHTWDTSERLLQAQGERIGDASDWPALMLES